MNNTGSIFIGTAAHSFQEKQVMHEREARHFNSPSN